MESRQPGKGQACPCAWSNPPLPPNFFSNLTLQKSLIAVGVSMLDSGQERDLIFNQAHCAAIPEFEIRVVCCFSKLIGAEMINELYFITTSCAINNKVTAVSKQYKT